MNKRKVFLFTLIIIMLLQLNVNANFDKKTLAEKFENVLKKSQLLSNNNVMLGDNTEETVKIQLKDEIFYEQLIGSYGAKKTDIQLEVEMTREQINALKEFEYLGNEQKKIKDISGIEYFTQLETLKLNKNDITDIEPIKNLTKLKNIEIKGNKLKALADLSALTNLQTLDISDNSITDLKGIKNNFTLLELNASSNQIVDIKPITSNLISLEVLNLSTNNISDISTIGYLSNLKKLDLSTNTSIREIEKIQNLEKLTTLKLANNNNIKDLTSLLNKKEETKEPKLINLQELDLERVNNNSSKISTSNLKVLTNLKVLNLNNNGITSITGIIELQYLEALYLNNNEIEDISPLVKLKKEKDGSITVEKVSTVKDLRMSNNKIEDIDILQYLSETITYLDLSGNKIHHISSIETLNKLEPKNLYLQNQEANFTIKRKTNTSVKQKIVLENIMQKCKDSNSKIYDDNAGFEVTGDAILNTDTYTLPNGSTGIYSEKPGYYNIVFAEDAKKDDQGIIEIYNGRAAGSIYTYTITDLTGNKVYDSICFEDYYLAERVTSELIRQEREIVKYVPYIINIEYPEINKIKELILTGSEDKKVENIKGLESFIKLENLNLATNNISSDNSISNIDLLKDLPNMKQLILTDNRLETADVVTDFMVLEKIDLSNNNIKNLQAFEEWLQKIKDNKKTSKLVEIKVSGNNIEDLTPIKDITTLENLNISKNKISNISLIENMKNLNILNISNNKIEDISILDKLTKLTTLDLSTNRIKDITSLKNLKLSRLDISNNRIDNLNNIRNMSSLIELKANTNKINTIEPIKDFEIKDFEITHQKLCYALTPTNEETVNIDLEKLFKEAKEENSLVYTDKDFECTNCTLTEDGKIQIDLKNFGDKIATVKIKSGNAVGSQISIGQPLKPIIKYNIENITNKDVIATIEFDGRQATIMNNDGKNTYTFTENGEFTFDYEDEYGFAGTATAKVDWIDKAEPVITGVLNGQKYNTKVTPVITDDNLEVVELKKDGTKIENYSEGEITENGEYTLTAKDKAGNITVVTFTIDFNANVKTLTDIEIINEPNKKIYKAGEKFDKTGMKVQAIYSDGNRVEVTNYEVVGENENLQVGTTSVKITYTENGITKEKNQEITVTETGTETGDLTVVIGKYEEETDENVKYIKGISPKTTIQTLVNSIETNGVIKIYKGTNEVTDKTQKIATGMTIKITKGTEEKTYTVVVIGDTNGDGEANMSDILKINKHRLGTVLLTGANLKAGNVNKDAKVDMSDILKINKYRLGKDTL